MIHTDVSPLDEPRYQYRAAIDDLLVGVAQDSCIDCILPPLTVIRVGPCTLEDFSIDRSKQRSRQPIADIGDEHPKKDGVGGYEESTYNLPKESARYLFDCSQ